MKILVLAAFSTFVPLRIGFEAGRLIQHGDALEKLIGVWLLVFGTFCLWALHRYIVRNIL